MPSNHNGQIVGTASAIPAGQTVFDRMTERYRNGIQPPSGYHYDDESGTVVSDTNFWHKYWPRIWAAGMSAIGAYGVGSAIGAGSGAATAGSTVGPSTAANMAATSAVAGSAPAGIAAGSGAATAGATAGAAAGASRGFGGFMSSPAGGAAINAGSSALMSWAQMNQDEQSRYLQALIAAAQLSQNQSQFDRNLASERATGVLNADPLGANQRYAQHNALMESILPGLHTQHSTPGDPAVAGAMGPSRLPNMSFDPDMVHALWGRDATMASIARRNQELMNLDPHSPVADLNSLYGNGADVNALMEQLRQWQQSGQLRDKDASASSNAQLNALLRAVLNMRK